MAKHSLGGGTKGNSTAKGQDTAGDDHPVNVLRKAVDLHTSVILVHINRERTTVSPEIAWELLDLYQQLRTPDEKEVMLNQIWSSREAFQDFLDGDIYIKETSKISLPGSSLIGGVRPL